MTDMTGKQINIGDRVAYPGRVSSHLWMTIGEVLQIDEEEKSLRLKILSTTGFARVGAETTIVKIKNVVVIGR